MQIQQQQVRQPQNSPMMNGNGQQKMTRQQEQMKILSDSNKGNDLIIKSKKKLFNKKCLKFSFKLIAGKYL